MEENPPRECDKWSVHLDIGVEPWLDFEVRIGFGS